jgi:bacillithiol system protein YtxJ
LDSIERLDELFDESHRKPVVVFKHSNSCGISSHLFEEIGEVEGDINVVVVQESRHVSDAIAERTGFRHHSPQAFVLKDGRAVYQASHYAIDPQKISANLEEN